MLYTAMNQHLADYVMLFGALGLQAIMAVVMFIRKLHSRLPVFFAYTVFHVAGSLLMWAATNISYADYFYTYWSLEIVDSFLVLLVIQEIFSAVLSEFESLKSLGELLFRWGTLLVVVITVFTASAAPGADSDRLVAGLMVLQRSVALVEIGLVMLLFFFCRWFALTWRDHVFGIALGFGISSSLVLASGGIRTLLGKSVEKMLELASLGCLNRIAGAAFGIFKGMLLVSALIYVIEIADTNSVLIKPEKKEASIFYKPIAKLIPSLVPQVKEGIERLKAKG